MADRKKKKRKPPISYRPPVGREDEFYSRFQKSGKSMNGFITHAVFGEDAPRQSPRPPVEAKLLAHLLAQAARISDQLNKITLSGKGSGNAQLLDEACANLTEIRSALLKMMGRKP